MYLEKLEIQGFKSFAHKTVLEFPAKVNDSKGITCIVGPNGSGKSNTSDAIRWVLGEQSIKTLRGKKSQDVIFSGSDKKARLGFAEVTMALNNEDQQIDIGYSQLAITRRVYQSGESEYLINNNKARLTDIQILLAKANFGQRTYSIIGQGMADSVLSASLQERKELFDEAVGVKQFQLKREQALNKFKATRENLAQTDLTIQEIEPRLKSLTRQVKRLERREEIAAELKDLQISYFGKIWQHLAEKLKEFSQKKNEVSKVVAALEKELQLIQNKITEFSGASSRQAQYASIQNEYNQLMAQKNSLLHEQTILRAKLDLQLETQGQSNLVWLNKRKEDIASEINGLKQEIKQVETAIKELEASQNEKQNKLTAINQRLNNVKAELSQLQKTCQMPFEAEKELEIIFSKQQQLVDDLLSVNQLSELEKIKNQAREISQKLSLYLEKLKGSQKYDTANLANLQMQLETLGQEKNELSLNSSQLGLQLTLKKEKLDSLQISINKLNQEAEKIEREISLINAQPGDKKELTAKIAKDIDSLEGQIKDLDAKIKNQENKVNEFNIEEQNKKETLINLQKDFQDKQLEFNRNSQEMNNLNIELTKYQTRQEDLETEIKQEALDVESINNYKAEVIIDENEAYQKIQQLKRQMEIIGGIDQETQTEYEETKTRFDFLRDQSLDLENAIKSLELVIEELDKNIKEQFDRAFKEINREFQQYFKILFNGGQAELVKISAEEIKQEEAELAEAGTVTEKPEEGILAQADKFAKRLKEKEKESYSGIEIRAVPPGKKIKSISMLSGGERALTAIALICAIISNNPSPFIVLDEVDAALDEANSERFNIILEQLARKTQFVVITHNRVTMHYANVLYGVTMGDDGISKLLSVKLADAEEMVGAARG